jgi:hypothetical protein
MRAPGSQDLVLLEFGLMKLGYAQRAAGKTRPRWSAPMRSEVAKPEPAETGLVESGLPQPPVLQSARVDPGLAQPGLELELTRPEPMPSALMR